MSAEIQINRREAVENLRLERESEGKVLSFHHFFIYGHTLNYYVRHPERNSEADCDAMQARMVLMESKHKGPYRGEIIPVCKREIFRERR